jgi:hypothetical protein
MTEGSASVERLGPEDRIPIYIASGQTLPDVCVECGQPSHRRARIRAQVPRQDPRAPLQVKMPCLFHLVTGAGCLFAVYNAVAGLFTRHYDRFTVRIPQCAECGRRGPPPASDPNYSRRHVSVRAHDRFVAALAKMLKDEVRREATRRLPQRREW